jgi:hypothetical protein
MTCPLVRYHLALVRRVAERRPDVQFVTYDRHPYQHTTGLTQLDLARLVRVAGRTVRRCMEGVCKPPAAALCQIYTKSVERRKKSAETGRPLAPRDLWDHPLRYLPCFRLVLRDRERSRIAT